MMFRRSVQRYGETPEPLTPYQKAAQVWDDRIGSARVQAKNWRLMAFGCLTLATLFAGGVLWQAGRSHIAPYVVEVDKLGEARAVSPANDAYQPSDSQTAWYLGRFITNVRGLSIDPVVVRRDWLEAYNFATDKGATFLNDFARANDPFAAVGTRSVSVSITSIVRASDSSFQVKWTEQNYKQGTLSGTEHWTAILGVVTQTPRTPDILRKNPLGIYVNAIAWTRELDSTSSN
jgi:type IV secretion system protein VirB5